VEDTPNWVIKRTKSNIAFGSYKKDRKHITIHGSSWNIAEFKRNVIIEEMHPVSFCLE